MRPDFRKTLVVQGHAFDVTISANPDGREVLHIKGDELQRLMQANQHAGLKAAFHKELERIRAKRRLQEN